MGEFMKRKIILLFQTTKKYYISQFKYERIIKGENIRQQRKHFKIENIFPIGNKNN